MKTRRLSTILTSAYLSAMLASSVSPVRSDATFAATIDPTAARQAFQSAVNGLEGNNWMVASNTPVAEPVAKVVFVNNPAPKTDPVMNEELMGRLIKYTRDVKEVGAVTARICKVLSLCTGTEDMPLKLAKSDSTDGEHYFGIPPQAGSNDILVMVKHGTLVETYLTDKTGRLRAAAVLENGTARLVPNDKAAEKFKQEMSLFAGEAGGLPPTGTSVVSNS